MDTLIQEENKKPMKKQTFWKGYILGILSSGLVIMLGFLIVSGSLRQGMTMKETWQAIWKIRTLTSYISEKSLDAPPDALLLEGAYAGLVNTVGDKYTRYYTQEEYKKYLEDLTGSYAGIGVSVQWDTTKSMLKIVEVNDPGPSAAAGLCVNDYIYAVDDQVVTEMQSDEIIQRIKGEENTKVKVTVLRGEEYKEFEIIRQLIVEESVFAEYLNENIGYIQLTAFDEVTTQQFEDAVEGMKEQGIQGLILDLRGNPGGRLQTAIEIADLLLPEGTVTYTETKQGDQKIYSSDAAYYDIPMVVLINENSASASEILAGAIQDMERGILIGTTTFGKGIVQSTYGLKDGSAIKITMAKYYTPSGKYIHGEGIHPDIEIDLAQGVLLDDVRMTEEDIQFMTALEALNTELAR